MLGVGDRVTNDLYGNSGKPLKTQEDSDGTHVLKENLQDTTSLLVDESRDTLDTTTASEATDGLSETQDQTKYQIEKPHGSSVTHRFGNTLDVVTKNLPVTLSAAPASDDDKGSNRQLPSND